MECVHIIGEVKNPLIDKKPVTITVESRLGVIGSLVGPQYLYFTSNLTMFDVCAGCGQNLQDIWKRICADAGVIRTIHLSKELFDGGHISI